MPSKAALFREHDLLAIAADLEQVAGPFVGGLVCIERRGRPWRIDVLTEVTPASVTTRSGHVYDFATGQPRFETKEFCLRPLLRENLDYLILVEGLRVADKLKANALKPAERAELMTAAQTLLKVYNKVRDENSGRLQEHS